MIRTGADYSGGAPPHQLDRVVLRQQTPPSDSPLLKTFVFFKNDCQI